MTKITDEIIEKIIGGEVEIDAREMTHVLGLSRYLKSEGYDLESASAYLKSKVAGYTQQHDDYLRQIWNEE